MKRVTFKVAKTLKEAGYPQDSETIYELGEEYDPEEDAYFSFGIAKPTYIEVWRWLWQEKNIHIEIIDSKITTQCYATINDEKDTILFKSPEEAIIAAIEYLCENNLIK